MSWQKIWLVLRREYLFNFKRPAFLFTAFGVPLISMGLMFFIFNFTANRETNLSGFQQVGYVDRAGVIEPNIPTDYLYFPVTDPALEPPDTSADADSHAAYLDALEETAKQQLLDGELDAYFVLRENYVRFGQVDLYTQKNVPAALHDEIENYLRNQIAVQATAHNEVPPPIAHRLSNPIDLTIRDLDTGDELNDAALIGRLMLPFIFVFVYFMATNTTAQFLMSGVVEEKENRLMEILATSLRPIELLWGKLLGLGALALTQVGLWAVAGVMIASLNTDAQDFVGGARFQPADIALIAVLFVINFLLFSAVMLGIGASVTAEAESRQIAGFFTFINVLPIMFSVVFFTNPDGPLPLFLTFFPPTAAVALIMRLGLTTLPMWQIALSVAIQTISVLAIMWLSAKVFRLGMLMYGKSLTPRALWRALREGRVTMTTAPEPQASTGQPARKRSIFGR